MLTELVVVISVIFLIREFIHYRERLVWEQRRWDLEKMVSARSHREYALYERLAEPHGGLKAPDKVDKKLLEKELEAAAHSVGNATRFPRLRRGMG